MGCSSLGWPPQGNAPRRATRSQCRISGDARRDRGPGRLPRPRPPGTARTHPARQRCLPGCGGASERSIALTCRAVVGTGERGRGSPAVARYHFTLTSSTRRSLQAGSGGTGRTHRVHTCTEGCVTSPRVVRSRPCHCAAYSGRPRPCHSAACWATRGTTKNARPAYQAGPRCSRDARRPYSSRMMTGHGMPSASRLDRAAARPGWLRPRSGRRAAASAPAAPAA